jgi:hypothetical protein
LVAGLSPDLRESLPVDVGSDGFLDVEIKFLAVVLTVALVHHYFVHLDKLGSGAHLARFSSQHSERFVNVFAVYESFGLGVRKLLRVHKIILMIVHVRNIHFTNVKCYLHVR